MTGAGVLLLVGLATIVSTGLVVALGAGRWRAATRRWVSRPCVGAALRRARMLRDGLVNRFGPVRAFLVLMAAAFLPIAIGCHILGVVVQHVPVTTIDVRLNSWFLDQQRVTPWLGDPVRAMNRIANWRETLTVSLLASVALGCMTRRRRWLPALLIGTVVLAEWSLQSTLNFTVDPSPPPTGRGLFPSGGTARVIAVYGTILCLALRRMQVPRWLAISGWIVIAVAAFLQGFARVFAGYHWTSDLAGGVLLGVLLLAATLAALTAFDVARVGPGDGVLGALGRAGERDAGQ